MCGDLWPVNLVGMEDEKHATFCEFIFQVVPNRTASCSSTAPGGLGQAVYVNAAVVWVRLGSDPVPERRTWTLNKVIAHHDDWRKKQ